jgi:hypothetical protein
MGRGAGWFGAALVALLVGAPVALADGGQTISGAPAIVSGQQEFGNTATWPADSNGIHHSYWGLSVTAGDEVTIDWEVPPAADNDNPFLRVYPSGTTDFSVDNTVPVHDQNLNSNGRNELVFSAPITGLMPLDFSADETGPYDFTVRVEHDVRLGLPAMTTLPLTGTVSVGVHNPDGVALSDPALIVYLQIKPKHGDWTTIGSAPASAGVATIAYTVASTLSGQKAALRAVSAGPSYVTDSTPSEKVLVGDAPPPPPRPVHHRHRHRHHHHHHHRHHRHHRHHHHHHHHEG